MYKRKLLFSTPLSTIRLIARPSPSPSPSPSTSPFPLNCTPHPKSSYTFSPSLLSSSLDSCRAFLTPRCSLLKKPNLSGKSFCSEPAGKAVGICWNCQAVAQSAPFLACGSCGSVQPVDQSVDYFQIFGLEKKFDIEDGNLENNYKSWQKKLHPDLVHSKSEKERECAAEQSARVIDAYRTLSKPLSRAIYILRLEGVDVDEEKTVSDPKMLTEIMEIREAVEEAADSEALNGIQSQIQEKLRFWSKSFLNAFQSQKFEEALTSIHRMTYYDRVNEEIVKKL